MDKLVRRFTQACEDPYRRLAELKAATGQMAIGCFPMYVPEELVHAAGALPVTVLGSRKPITAANGVLPSYLCSLVRSSFDLALSGDLDFLDGIIFPDICDAVQCLADLWKEHCPRHATLSYAMPGKANSPSTRPYLIAQLRRLKAGLEGLTGRRIDDAALHESIALFNEHRAQLRRLYALRQANPGLWSAQQVLSIVASGMQMPKNDHLQLLAELLNAFEGRPACSPGRVRLLLVGSPCQAPEPAQMLDMIEELGAVVVDDDLFTGRKYFIRDVRQDDDPVEALADHFLEFVPCPSRHNPAKDWPDYVVELARQSDAQGVVLLTPKFCEVIGFDIPYIDSRLNAVNIPHFFIETDHEMTSLGQVRTRLQAFIEMLGGA